METNKILRFCRTGWVGRPNDYVIIQDLYDLLVTSDNRFGGWGPVRPKHLLRNTAMPFRNGTLTK